MKRLLAAFAISGVGIFIGCVKEQCPVQASDVRNLCSNGIPNFQLVTGSEANGHAIYRGGQPTEAGWSYLHTLGVTTVVKLNDAQAESLGQGMDDPASRLGMRVVDASIPPRDFGLSLKSMQQVVEGLPEDQVGRAIATLAGVGNGSVYVHCTHGRDRTGLIVGLFRVFQQHWKAEDAYREMKQEGFRPINANLFVFWHKLFDDDKESLERRERLQASINIALQTPNR